MEYQDIDDQAAPKPKELLVELDDIEVSLKEGIQDNPAVIVGVGLLHDLDKWFGTSKQAGIISIKAVSGAGALHSNKARSITMHSVCQYNIILKAIYIPQVFSINPIWPMSLSSLKKCLKPSIL